MEKISERIRYVGVNDFGKELFEGLWPLPYGVSYNSYIIADEKVALVDTLEGDFCGEYLEKIREATEGRPVDYLIVNHMEPDHSSLIKKILSEYPDAKIVTNAKAVPMIQGYHGISGDFIRVVKEGDSISLGNCTLRFFMAPMVHWPETMVTWLEEEKTLFSGDAFGTFGAVDAEDGLTEAERFTKYRDEMMRYYSNIVGKYGLPVQSALKKLSGLPIGRICSTHGPVWEQEIGSVTALYDRLSRYDADNGVCIVYGSMYGNTAKAALALAEELAAKGIPYAIHDLTGRASSPEATAARKGEYEMSAAIRDAFRFNTIAVGSPTCNNGIFPPVETFMRALSARLVKNRRFFAFGSYTWAAASVRLLNGLAEELGFTLISEGKSFAQAWSREKCDMSAVAELMKQE